MKCSYHNINFNLNQMMIEELPWTQAFYREAPLPPHQIEGEFHADVQEYFSFPLAHSAAMPVYELGLSSCAKIESQFELAYSMLVEAVGRLFGESNATLMEYVGCEFLRNHPYFIEYAKFTYRDFGSARQAIYGRFDAAFDPVAERITGIYEFNGDTPTMLFESVALQNHVCEQVTGDTEMQLNSFYPNMQQLIADLGPMPGTAAVVFDKNSFEDLATCEVIAQILGENNTCLYADVDDIDYLFSEKNLPFAIGEDQLSVIFALVPWEEMVESFPQAYREWANWGANLTFFEPAWRWFASNKGIWAYITHLFETDKEFGAKYKEVPAIKTHLTPEPFTHYGQGYVAKPKVGRMSCNVEIFNAAGEKTFGTEGPYTDEVVYQSYVPPHSVVGRNNFIIGMFMVPDVADNLNTMKQATASTLCIREFDSPVLGVANERFIPHVLVDDANRVAPLLRKE